MGQRLHEDENQVRLKVVFAGYDSFLQHKAMVGQYSPWPCVYPSVCHKPVFYRNVRADRAGFRHGEFCQPYPTSAVLLVLLPHPKLMLKPTFFQSPPIIETQVFLP